MSSVGTHDSFLLPLGAMAERDQQHVPSWDGQARTWRRYTREVCWYVRATPTQKRRYCANKLLSRLSGPARLLAMSWNDVNFDHSGGTRDYLRKLALSPLVRQALPNAAAICQQYFAFRRHQGEAMHAFLVREALGYSEFVEAIIRLHEEKMGLEQHEKDFGLPPDEDEDDPSWSDEWWNHGWWREAEPQHPEAPDEGNLGEATPVRERPAEQQGPSSPAGTGAASVHASSPSKRSVGVEADGAPPGFDETPLTELSMADSFVLGVLRGFRLLQASGLSHEDKRDIISSTRGSLDFDVICRALQTMWDEQLLGTRHGHGSFSNHYVQHEAQYVGDQWDDSGWWDYDAMYEYGWDDWEDGSWHDDFYQHGDHHEQAEPSAPEPSSTSDAMAAASQETQNESFAMDGQRTWSEAQRATAALRRDRGFGQVKGSGKSFPGRGCFICGGNHSYRDCPDQGHPGSHFGKSKGKSSFGNYFTEYDMHDNYFVGKGKGKHKGNRGRQLSWMEAQAIMKGKKGKSKGFSSRPPVNAYVQDMFVGGMEAFSQDQPRNSSTNSGSSMKPGHGLLDCGATASAGPEDSVNNLITAVLSVDKGASIRVGKYMRPYFRFGNGRWGQALHRVSITSKVSGKPRTLQIFSLPNPSEDKDPYGVKNVNLVPVLLGMDHLSGKDQHESSLAIDFTTGLALDPLQEHPVVFQLPSNHKGHYIRDLVEYLTLGFSDLTGTPSIHVVEQGEGTEELQVLEFHPVEYYDISNDTFTFTSDVEKIEQSRQALMLLHSSRRACMSATLEAINSSMLANPVTGNPNSISLTSGDHGLSSQQSFSESGSCGVGQHQSCNPQEESGSRLRLLSHHAGRPKRSTELEDSVAMLRGSCAPEAKGQSSWTVDSLCNLRVPHGVHTSSGIPKQLHQDREPSICDQDVGGVGTSHAGTPAQRGCVPCDAQQDLCGGATSPGHQEGDCEYGDQDVWVCQGQESLSCQQPRSVLGNGKCTSDSTSGRKKGRVTFHPGCNEDASHRGGAEQDHGDCATKAESGKLFGKPGSGLREGDVLKSEDLYRPLPRRIGAKTMMAAAMMLSTMTSLVNDFTLDKRYGLWEVACAPHSWLSESASQNGLRPRRINLSNGFDLYKKETWQELRQLRRRHRPRRLWFSLPCTKWCPWTSVNYNTPEKREILEAYRRRERRMLNECVDFIIETIFEDDSVDLYWEWPHPCFGWSEPSLARLARFLEQRGQSWLRCRIDGCCYGLQDSHGDFLRKKWIVRTTDEKFNRAFGAKLCPGNHRHGLIEGRETAKTSYYPWKMCQAFCRHWASQAVSTNCLRCLFKDKINDNKDEKYIHAAEDLDDLDDSAEVEDLSLPPPAPGELEPSQQERDRWMAKLHHFHRAAGHPSVKNLVRLVRDANLESWKVKMAHDFVCPTCASLKPGGSSSGKVPPAATHAQFGPWQALGLDAGEWFIPGTKSKLKFLLMIDMTTRLRVVHVLMDSYDITTMKTENAEQVIQGVSTGWLGHYPKPRHIIADNGMSFVSARFCDFCRDLGIDLSFPAEKESWAHGLVEHAVKDLKHAANAIKTDAPDLDPTVALALAQLR